MNDFSELESAIGYKFSNINYLRLAMTHSSYANEKNMAKNAYNERIEFLGDAVLELVTSEYLYKNYTDMKEGDMSKLRAKLVCEQSLSDSARTIRLGQHLLLGKGEDATDGRNRDSILCDAYESLIGAIFLDGGYDKASEFIHKYVLSDIENKTLYLDSKTSLQELAQARFRQPVIYKVIDEKGPEHDKTFTVAAYIGTRKMAVGMGPSKKAASKDAAYKTLIMLNDNTAGGNDVS